MVAGVIFMGFGIIGIYRFESFYARLLTTSKADTVGALTLAIGVMFRHGFSFFTGKIILIAAIMLIFTPLVSHILARSAFLSGHDLEDEVIDRR